MRSKNLKLALIEALGAQKSTPNILHTPVRLESGLLMQCRAISKRFSPHLRMCVSSKTVWKIASSCIRCAHSVCTLATRLWNMAHKSTGQTAQCPWAGCVRNHRWWMVWLVGALGWCPVRDSHRLAPFEFQRDCLCSLKRATFIERDRKTAQMHWHTHRKTSCSVCDALCLPLYRVKWKTAELKSKSCE